VSGRWSVLLPRARSNRRYVDAARVLAEHPGRPLPHSPIQTDALRKLQAEQERVVREIEGERAEAIKGQRIK
jgi:type IV secretion system T-DNA border endonuclease VirD2